MDSDAMLRHRADLRRAIMRSGRPAADRFLLIRVLDLESVRGEAVAAVSDLAEDLGMSPKTASRSLRRLEADECFRVVRRSRLEVGRRIRPQAFGLDPAPDLESTPPSGGEGSVRIPTASSTPPSGGVVRLRQGARDPSGSQREAEPVGPDLSFRVNSPPIVPPSTEPTSGPAPDLREEDEPTPAPRRIGGPTPVVVADFESARRRMRQLVGLRWLARRAMPITADDVNERRIALWIWEAAGADPGAFESLLADLVEAWLADDYVAKVRRPWAHLQAQLVTLREQIGSRGGAAVAGERKLEAELDELERQLVDAVSFGYGFDREQELEAQIATVRDRIRGVA